MNDSEKLVMAYRDQRDRCVAQLVAERTNLAAANEKISRLEAELADEKMEHNLLKELLSHPEIDDFWEGIVLEAAHQRQRWGDAHDRSKSAENWYWLVGYLAGKALRAAIEGAADTAKHHTIGIGSDAP